jgi:hypothetical protein
MAGSKHEDNKGKKTMTKNYITLYHYSNSDFDGRLSPCHFAENAFTFNDLKASSVKRVFFYDTPNPEALLKGSRFLYIASVEASAVYDLRQDKGGYIKRYESITEILKAIISAGHKGIIYSIGHYNIICLFSSVKILQKKRV